MTGLWESEPAHETWVAEHVRAAMPADAPTPSITYRPITRFATATDPAA